MNGGPATAAIVYSDGVDLQVAGVDIVVARGEHPRKQTEEAVARVVQNPEIVGIIRRQYEQYGQDNRYFAVPVIATPTGVQIGDKGYNTKEELSAWLQAVTADYPIAHGKYVEPLWEQRDQPINVFAIVLETEEGGTRIHCTTTRVKVE